MDYKKISNVVVVLESVYPQDYPDFCDAYIVSADYDGEPMTDEQIKELNLDRDFIYESVQKKLF